VPSRTLQAPRGGRLDGAARAADPRLPMATSLHAPESAASLARRGAAALLDALLVALLVGLAIAGVEAAASSLDLPDRSRLSLELAGASLPIWLYFALTEASRHQATFAKRLLGLRVVDVYGGRIGWRRASLRAAVKLAPWIVALVALSFPEPVFDTRSVGLPKLLFAAYAAFGLYLAAAVMTLKKQSVHDLAAGTWVVSSASPAAHA
jgi:uncharacterized RDD family membrane protein YckC